MREVVTQVSILSFVEATVIFVFSLLLQSFIFVRRTRGGQPECRRFELRVVGLNLLILTLGLYLASAVALAHRLETPYPGGAVRLVMVGFLIIVSAICVVAGLIANPDRKIYPADQGHAYLVRDSVNFVGYLALASYLFVLIGLMS